MHSIRIVRDIHIGQNALEKAPETSRHCRNACVVCDSTTEKIAGKRVADLCSAEIIRAESGCSDIGIRELEENVRGHGIIFAVGGGSIIDMAKVAAFNTDIGFVSVPTTCSNDGIASPNASVRNGGGPISRVTKPPLAIIVDTGLLAGAPDRFIRSGIGDSVAKHSAVKDWHLSHIKRGEAYGHYAAALSVMTADQVMHNSVEIMRKTDQGLSILAKALISSGVAMGIAGSSRPASGSEHKISHAMDILAGYPSLHGSQVGVATIVSLCLQGADWMRMRNTLQSAGCPVDARGLGMDGDLMLEAVMKAAEIRPDRYTVLEDLRLDRGQARRALEETQVI